MEYRRVVGIVYNDKHFEIFKDSEARYAILEYDDNARVFHFPKLKDVVNIVARIIPKKSFQFMQVRPEKTKTKKYRFKNLVKVPLAMGTVLLSTTLLFSYLNENEITSIFDFISTGNETIAEVDSENLELEQSVDNDTENIEDIEGIYSDDVTSITVDELDSSNPYYTINEVDKIITVTNTKALDELLGYKFVSEEQIITRINEKNYSNEMKGELAYFVKTMNSYYNNEIDFRVFFENLRTLRFNPFPKSEQTKDNIAYYDYINNIIYISPDIDFNNEMDMIILRHELGHVVTSGFFYMNNGYRIKKTFFGKHQDGMYANEALTVLFTTYPFLDSYSAKTKENMGYPLATNIYRPIVLFMDNYSLAEMSKTDIYYFTKKMGEKYSRFTNATTFVDKVEFQVGQFYNNDFIVLEQDSYYIYETIADIYLSFVATEDMGAEEIEELREQVKSELKMGIIAEFKQNFAGIDDAFDEYIDNINNKKIR